MQMRQAAAESFGNETARISGSLSSSRLGHDSRKHTTSCDPGNMNRSMVGLDSG